MTKSGDGRGKQSLKLLLQAVRSAEDEVELDE